MKHRNTTSRIAVGLSGGVDSAVCALLLRDQGHEVIGVTLLLHDTPSLEGERPREPQTPSAQAAAVAEQINIPHHVIDLRERFESEVLRPCWGAFERGTTPNPCVLCNPLVKFHGLLNAAHEYGCDAVATGHYARVTPDGQLLRGADTQKDQSYFLHALDTETLARTRFPLGGMTKPEVRARARQYGLASAEKPESQDVCFGDAESHIAEALRQRYHGQALPGVITDEAGNVLRRHDGIHRFTLGQRRGLGVATGQRAKVISISTQDGTIVISSRPDASCRQTCSAEHVRWHGEPSPCGASVTAQVRYRQKPVAAIIEALSPAHRTVSVRFTEPVFSVTPGQSLVLYDGDRVIGGGVIR
ncbi:MAG: tRNA 2-thiouridine(34) synthase MnmA [Kiritimatiellaeota bacterium]|nr:tRNA 2-thiouridine(34) synthase MnmA [Kiritimatiellota bacterium]